MSQSPLLVRAMRRRSSLHHQLTTPEGMRLEVKLAPVGSRALAFLVDNIIITFLTGLVIGVGAAFTGLTDSLVFISLGLFATFFIRHFYFLFFEIRDQGRSPGKRLTRLRVIARDGRPLRADALFVRNITRDLETTLPLVLLFDPELLWPGAGPWTTLVASLWLALIALLPLFNRQRLRVGDLLGGTLVISYRTPEKLLEDLAIGAMMRVENHRPLFTFSPDQLDIYGRFELEVLEEALQRHRRAPDAYVLRKIAITIQQKIGWRGACEQDQKIWQFLHDFYAASRARLERRWLLGDPQEFKKEGSLSVQHGQLISPHHSGVFSLPATPAVSTKAPAPEQS